MNLRITFYNEQMKDDVAIWISPVCSLSRSFSGAKPAGREFGLTKFRIVIRLISQFLIRHPQFVKTYFKLTDQGNL